MKAFSRALLALIVFSVLTGLAYPLVITGLARLLFPEKAGGSMVIAGDRIVGSTLIGQKFTDPRYFHGRPSANDYDATNSGGTNLAPSNAKFIEEVGKRISLARRENGLPDRAPIPADLVLASASGLDPDISIEATLVQSARVAKARGLSDSRVSALVRTSAKPQYGFGGDGMVNVLNLNLSLDALEKR
jgi:potassium-transporting ATPase KdpC subunit